MSELRAYAEGISVPLSVIAADPKPYGCRDCKTLILAREKHINLPHGRYHITCILRILEALK